MVCPPGMNKLLNSGWNVVRVMTQNYCPGRDRWSPLAEGGGERGVGERWLPLALPAPTLD